MSYTFWVVFATLRNRQQFSLQLTRSAFKRRTAVYGISDSRTISRIGSKSSHVRKDFREYQISWESRFNERANASAATRSPSFVTSGAQLADFHLARAQVLVLYYRGLPIENPYIPGGANRGNKASCGHMQVFPRHGDTILAKGFETN
jgi:hypothetical protein